MPKIFDCCILNNELKMLKTRMHILAPVVDYFVVCESGETHSGKTKPYHLLNNKAIFAEWADRIIYVQIEKLSDGTRNSWERERYHRSCIGQALEDMAEPDDMVIVSDCDEIANPDIVLKLRDSGIEGAQLELDFYYYNLNCKVDQGWAIGAYRWGKEKDPNVIRTCGSLAAEVVHYNSGGWHFSYFGGAGMIAHKMDSFMHHDDPVIRDTPRDKSYINRIMSSGRDLYGRDIKLEQVALSSRLPRYILDHMDDYKDWVA